MPRDVAGWVFLMLALGALAALLVATWRNARRLDQLWRDQARRDWLAGQCYPEGYDEP